MMDGGTTPYAAFISHSSRDGDAAFALVDALEATGLRVWIAPRDIPAGSTFSGAIVEGIEQSACFVLLLSGAANVSPNVLSEVEKAATLGKPIFPVRLEDVQPSRDLELYIKMIQWVDALDRKMDVAAPLLSRAFRDRSGGGTRGPMQHDNPYAVADAYTGPVLPLPREGENWAPVLSQGDIKRIREAEIGESARQWSEPTMMGWSSKDRVFFGGWTRLLEVSARGGHSTSLYSIPKWRGRMIRDVAARQRYDGDTSVFVAGNSFIADVFSGPRTWKGYDEVPFTTGWWTRIELMPGGMGFLHTANTVPKKGRRVPAVLWSGATTESDNMEIAVYGKKNSMTPTRRFTCARFGGELTMSVSISPSGRFVGFPHTYALYYTKVLDLDAPDGPIRPLADFPDSDGLGGLCWHPAQDLFVCIVGSGSREDVGICDPAGGEVLEILDLPTGDRATAFDWSPDGRFIAIGRRDHSVVLWDFARRAGTILAGHTSAVQWVAFSPDGKRLMSCAGGETRLWSVVDDGAPLAALTGFVDVGTGHRLKGSPWSPSGRRIALFTGGAMQVYELGQVA
jgi:hypothetical protein